MGVVLPLRFPYCRDPGSSWVVGVWGGQGLGSLERRGELGSEELFGVPFHIKHIHNPYCETSSL